MSRKVQMKVTLAISVTITVLNGYFDEGKYTVILFCAIRYNYFWQRSENKVLIILINVKEHYGDIY